MTAWEKPGLGNITRQAMLAGEEYFESFVWHWQRIFAPQNRPFYFYTFFVLVATATGAWIWSDKLKTHALELLMASPTDYLGKYLSREFIAQYLPSAEGFWLVELCVVAFFWFITRPQELRAHRWEKIGTSVALVYLLLAGLSVPISPTLFGRGENCLAFLGYVLPAMVFAAMWTPELVWHLARFFTLMVDPAYDQDLAPSLRPAYRAVRTGEFRHALSLAQDVLLTDFRHYEALLLVARVQWQLGRTWRARLTLHRALRNPKLMDGQRERIIKMLRELDAGISDGWVLAGAPKAR